MAFFKTTKSGKCDVDITLLTKDNTIIYKSSSTFDIRPTIKGLKKDLKKYKQQGAYSMIISTTPAWEIKTIKL